MRACVLILVAAWMLACSSKPEPEVTLGGDESDVGEDASAPAELRFGWKPGWLAVVEKVHKKGREIETAYTLWIAPIDEGLSVTYRDFRFISLSGLGLEDAAVAAVIDDIDDIEAEIGVITPVGFRVTSEGTFIGLLDVDTMLSQFEVVQGQQKATELRQLLEDPQWRELTEQAAAAPWRAWVEVWLGLDVEPGDILEAEVESEFAGAALLQHVRVEHLGLDDDRPGHVRLRYESRIDDPRYWSAVGNLAANLPDKPAPEKLEKMREVVDQAAEQLEFLHERIIEVILDSRTMVPTWAKYQMRTRIRGPGGSGEPEVDIDTVESREWSFRPIGFECVRVWSWSGC
jgi:hypothetical protein